MARTSHIKCSFAALTAVLALGCQVPDDDDDEHLLVQDAPCAPSIDGGSIGAKLDASVDGVDDGGIVDAFPDAGSGSLTHPIFTAVSASGNGCPAGTRRIEIAPDGSDFRVYFDAFYARVEDGTRSQSRECNLAIELTSPSGMSYAVSEFIYDGSVHLEEGVTAYQTANYYFQGFRAPTEKEKRTDLTGPVDRSYSYVDKVTTTDLVWSPCGLDRNLNVTIRLGLTKSSSVGEGVISLPEVRAPKLVFRACKP